MQCFVNTERYKSTKITPNPAVRTGGRSVLPLTRARIWVQRHAEKFLTPNPLFVRAERMASLKPERKIWMQRHRCRHAGKIFDAGLSYLRGQVVHFCTNCGAILGPAPSLVHKAKELSSPSSWRQGKKQRRTREKSGPASRKIQKLTLNPVVGAGRQCIPTQTAARYWVQRHRWSVRQELNLRTYGRSVLLYPLSYGQIRAA